MKPLFSKGPETESAVTSQIGLWLFCLTLACLPLIYPAVPPYTDVFGHIGRYHVQINSSKIDILASWYSFEWTIIPNLGYDILMQILGPILGVEPATKLLVILSQAICAASILWVSKSQYGSVKFGAVMAIPFLYHYAFNYGFLNYSLSLGLAFGAFVTWRKLHKTPVIRLVTFSLLSSVLFVCHIYGWAIMCILIGSDTLVKNIETKESWMHAFWATTKSCLILTLPFVAYYFFLSGSYDSSKNMFVYKSFIRKLAFIFMAVRDRWAVWDIMAILVVIGIVVFAIRNTKFKIDKTMALALVICCLIYFIMPSTLLGSAFADMRLVPVIFILALLMIDDVEQTYKWLLGFDYPALATAAAAIPENGFDYLWALNLNAQKPGPDWTLIDKNEHSAIYKYVGATP